jgi:hypothetical protein
VRLPGETRGPYGNPLDALRVATCNEDFTLIGRKFPAKFVEFGDELRIAFLLSGLQMQYRVRLVGCALSRENVADLEKLVGAALVNVECGAMDDAGRAVIVAHLRDRTGANAENINARFAASGVPPVLLRRAQDTQDADSDWSDLEDAHEIR